MDAPDITFDYDFKRLRSNWARWYAPRMNTKSPRWMVARTEMYEGEWNPDRYLDPRYVAWVRAWKKPLGGTD